MNNLCLACTKPRELTNEHIIPQAIGGRLKAPIFCKECNSTFGRELDAEVSKQFGLIATSLNIKRERGKPQTFEVKDIETGTTLITDGKSLKRKDPDVPPIVTDGKKLKSANVTARDDKELKEIIASINNKYKTNGDWYTFHDHHPGPRVIETEKMMFNSTKIRRAVSKIAFSFLCTKLPRSTVLSSSFDVVRDYMKTGHVPDIATANYIHTKFMTDHVRPLHKIHVALNRREELVVGFVSIFGMFRYTVLLAEGYKSIIEWSDLDYTFDPVRLEEVKGKDTFKARDLTRGNILNPKESKKFVEKEINRGWKTIGGYLKDIEPLEGELS